MLIVLLSVCEVIKMKNKKILKKPAKKKKKSGNLMKRAQKNFERDPTKKNFWSSETLRDAKAKNHEQSS